MPRSRRGERVSGHGQSRNVSAEQAVEYVESAFRAILGHGQLREEDLRGWRVLELGPGDNLGLALRFLAAGARQVVTLDRFEVARDTDLERQIYRKLLDRLPQAERGRVERALDLAAGLKFDERLLRPISGVGAEEALNVLEHASFDLIISVAVLEHVDDSDAVFSAMDQLLKPGGVMLHQVDLRDHALFSGGGQHPLTFLTIRPWIWRVMISGWGGPNRRLIDYYRETATRLGYDARLLVNSVLGADAAVEARDALAGGVAVSTDQQRLIAQIRPRLQPPFRTLSDEDLVATGLFVVARKPGPGAGSTAPDSSTEPGRPARSAES